MIATFTTETHCAYCERPFNDKRLPTREHFIPLSKGGSNGKKNILIVCQPCNTLKSNDLPNEFIYYLDCKIRWNEPVRKPGFSHELCEVIKNNVKKFYTDGLPVITPIKQTKKTNGSKKMKKMMGDICLSVNSNTRRQSKEKANFLQYQSVEDFLLIRKHGPIMAKWLAEPESNFHEQ